MTREPKKTEMLEIRVSSETKSALQAKARDDGKSVSEVLRHLIAQYLGLQPLAHQRRRNIMRLSSLAAGAAALVLAVIALTPSANAGGMLLGLSALIELRTPQSSSRQIIETTVQLDFVLHMVFKHHNSDFQKVSSEDQVMSDLRKANLSPGDYVLPHTTDNKVRNSQEFKDKMNQGPVVMMTVFPSGQTGMGASLTLWFLFSLVVGIFAAYIAGHALPAGSNYLSVFRFTGTTAFIGYGLPLVHDSIWYKRKWSTTFNFIFDGLIYALFTAGVFGWLWPAM